MATHTDGAAEGHPIQVSGPDSLQVPADPIVPFIEGDGCGPDVWRAARRVIDGAVDGAYRGSRRIAWHELLAGEKAYRQTGEWLPEATVGALRRYLVGIKGPLATPADGGYRSLNVALRSRLDLFAALRPIRWYPEVPSPVRAPAAIDLLLFRENTEDVHTGMEWPAASEEAKRLIHFVQDELGVRGLRFPASSALGLKPMSRQGTERLVRFAIEHALGHGRRRLTLVHKGDVMKFTEGAFRAWGYALGCREYRDLVVTRRESAILASHDAGPALAAEARARLLEPSYGAASPEQQAAWRAEVDTALGLGDTHGSGEWRRLLLLDDVLLDAALQQLLARPQHFDVLVAPNLGGDLLGDFLAAQVGGSAMVPGVSVNPVTGHALFECQHGTAAKHAGQDRANPCSLILSGEMMLRHLGWVEAADRLERGLRATLAARHFTADLARDVPGLEPIACSAFADRVVEAMA